MLVKDYLLRMDFEKEAKRIADIVNNSTEDLKEKRSELAEVNAKIQNGLKALLNGFDDFPELRTELDRLRVRKSELEDIIGRRTASRKTVNPANIVKVFQFALDDRDNSLPKIIRQHITIIYAHADGTYSVNIGVHINVIGTLP